MPMRSRRKSARLSTSSAARLDCSSKMLPELGCSRPANSNNMLVFTGTRGPQNCRGFSGKQANINAFEHIELMVRQRVTQR